MQSRIMLLLACLLACGAHEAAPKTQEPVATTPPAQTTTSEGTTITTTVIYKLTNGALSDVRAEGASEALKKSCIRDLQQTLQVVATSRPDLHVGEPAGPGEWKFQCFDSYPK